MDPDEVEVTKNAPPKKRAQYPAILTEQVWSIKYLLYGLKVTPKNFALSKTKQEILSGQDRPILPARVASGRICFILPAPWSQPYNKTEYDMLF